MRRWKICFIVVMILWMQGAIVFSESETTVGEVVNKLDDISSDEKIILEQLFLLSQEIDNLQVKEEKLNESISSIKLEIQDISEQIETHSQAYQEMLIKLGNTLKNYQKSGVNSYLELIFSSDSVKTFVQKLNILRDYTKSNKELMDDIEERKTALDLSKAKKASELQALESNEADLRNTIQSKMETKNALEASLNNLKSERAQYEAYLLEVQETWNTLKPLFRETVDEFSRLVVSDGLPYDAIDLEFSLQGVKGILGESIFNNILEKQAKLPKLIFEFHPDLMTVSIPEKKISLSGNFEIVDGHILKFIVSEGTFYGLPLEQDSMDELFSEGYMSIDLTYLLEGYKIETVTLKENSLELYVKPALF